MNLFRRFEDIMAWQEALKLLSAVEVQSMLYATYDIGYIDEKHTKNDTLKHLPPKPLSTPSKNL